MSMSHTRTGLWTLLTLAGGALVMWLTTSASLLGMFTQAVIYAIFALGVGVLLRQNGLVSFGHALSLAPPAMAWGSTWHCNGCPPSWRCW